MEKPVAVVTGAASGIGLALSRALAGAGYRVALSDVRPDALEAARSGLADSAAGVEAIGVVTDVTDDESVEDLADRVEREWGRIDVAINNAGVIGPVGRTWEGPLEQWELAMRINYWGVVHGMRAFLPRMISQGHGRLVNVASVAAWSSGPQMGSYGSAKHAVLALTESAHRELIEIGTPVRISVVCPTTVRTSLVDHLREPGAAASSEGASRLLAAQERGHAPDEVAAVVLAGIAAGDYLISTDPEWVINAARQRLDIAGGATPPMNREPIRH